MLDQEPDLLLAELRLLDQSGFNLVCSGLLLSIIVLVVRNLDVVYEVDHLHALFFFFFFNHQNTSRNIIINPLFRKASFIPML